MSSEQQKQRLSKLLREMQGEVSLRAFARKIKVNYASVAAYTLGDSFPETKNLEKIAAAKGWTREELEAYLEERPIQPKKAIDEILKEVRVMSPQDAAMVAKVAIDRVMEASGVYNSE